MEIALKEVSGSFHPLQMTFTRFLAGGLFLIPFAVRTLKKKKASLIWKDLPGFLLLGFVGMVLEWIRRDMKTEPAIMAERLNTMMQGDLKRALLRFSTDGRASKIDE